MLKKLIGVFILVLLTVSCGGKNGGDKEGVVEIKIAHDNAVTASGHLGILEFKKIVEEKSGGKINVIIYPGGQLGDNSTMFEMTRRGDIQMAVGDPTLISQTIPEYSLWTLFYLFDSYEHVYAFLDGPVAKKLLEPISAFDVTGLGYLSAFGFRNLSNSKRAVNFAKDVEGLKIRGYNPTQIKGWEGAGVHLSTISWTELFTSLQQNLIDGQECATVSFYEQRFYETQKYWALTQHIYTSWLWYANTEFLNGLSLEYRKIIDESVAHTIKIQRDISSKKEEEALTKLREAGVEITEFPLDQKAILRDKMNAAIVDIVVDNAGEQLYGEFMSGVEDARKESAN